MKGQTGKSWTPDYHPALNVDTAHSRHVVGCCSSTGMMDLGSDSHTDKPKTSWVTHTFTKLVDTGKRLLVHCSVNCTVRAEQTMRPRIQRQYDIQFYSIPVQYLHVTTVRLVTISLDTQVPHLYY